MFNNRLVGSLPKVGIRPVIDGRMHGIREGLELQTMEMARTAKNFIEEMKHPNGEHIECVLADSTIGGVNESAKCEDKFIREGIDITLTITPCWCYGTETMDTNKSRIKAIWGFNGTERPGAVYLAAASAAHDQLGLPVFTIYGEDVQDANDKDIPHDVQQKLELFVTAAIAVATMKNKSYLSVGGTSMGIAGSIIDSNFFSDYLGMRNEYVDMSEVERRIELGIYDPIEFERAYKWVRQNCITGLNYNREEKQVSLEQLDKEWVYVVKMVLIFRDLMVGNKALEILGFKEEALGHNAIAAGFQGQRQWTDFRPNGDFLETILNSSFDWNGIREAFIVATENDSLNGVSMLLGHLLTGTAQIFSDVRTFWSKDSVKRVTGYELEGKAKNGIIHLINSGSTCLDGTGAQCDNDRNPIMKPFYNINQNDVDACLRATEFCPSNRDYMRGGGFSSRFLTKGKMKVTMFRINIVKGLGPVLQIAEGHTIDLPSEVHNIIDLRTDPAWPTTWFSPNLTGEGVFKDVYSVMNNWGANHAAISYGHIGDKLITIASMLRIPVALHNVSEDRIFRPKTWAAFGTKNLESADFRACKLFGPRFRKF
jgi:L-fucose isomerase